MMHRVVIFVLLFVSRQALSLFNARKLMEQSGFLPTLLLKLDTVLHGGLPTATITEVGTVTPIVTLA